MTLEDIGSSLPFAINQPPLIDSLEKKFGKGVVHLGSTDKAIKTKTLGTDSDDLDRDLLFL
jgi:hypothetical protein